MSDALQSLRDGLRQAAVHSPSLSMRMLAEAALDDPAPRSLAAVTSVVSCSYATRLRTLIDDYTQEAAR